MSTESNTNSGNDLFNSLLLAALLSKNFTVYTEDPRNATDNDASGDTVEKVTPIETIREKTGESFLKIANARIEEAAKSGNTHIRINSIPTSPVLAKLMKAGYRVSIESGLTTISWGTVAP